MISGIGPILFRSPARRSARHRSASLTLVIVAVAIVAAWSLAPRALAIPSSTADASWGVNGHVSAIVQVGNVAFVGGTFTQIAENGGAGPETLARSNIAAFDTTTGQPLRSWAPSFDGEVAALAVSADGTKVFAGGAFKSAGGLARTRLAALDAATGAVDPNWKPSASWTVGALAVVGGRLYIGGDFKILSGQSRPYLGAVSAATGALDTTWAPAADAKVRSLAVSPDGSRIYAGGDFTTVAGTTRKNLVQLDAVTGAVASGWHPDPGYRVFGVAANATRVFTAGGGSANSLASWDGATGVRQWVKKSDGDFQAIGISGGIVYAGGHFLIYDGHENPRRIVAVDANTGNLRPDWDPSVQDFGLSGVWAVSVSAGRVVIGGDFTAASGVSHAHYAQFSGPTDGPLDTQPPTAPGSLFASAVGSNKVNLSWMASSDDVGVSGYTVVRDGVEIAQVAGTTYADETVKASTTYTYTVKAFDSGGHVSAASNSSRVTTGAPDDVRTFAPTDDAAIDSTAPNTNKGSATTLEVDADPARKTLLKFAVSGVGNRRIASAKLRVYCTDSSNEGGYVRPASTNSWSQSTVTWNNAPTGGTAVTNLSDVTKGNWYTVDVTRLVTGDGEASMLLDSPITDGAQFSSKEGSFPPQLVVHIATDAALPFTDGFESGDLSKWTSATNVIAQQSERFSGSWGARATTTSAAAYLSKDLTQSLGEVYQQVRFKIISQGANAVILMRERTSAGGAILRVYLDANGRLAYRNDVAATAVTSTAKPAVGTWHTLQVHTLVNATAGQVETWLDGTKVPELSKTESLGTTGIGKLQLGDDNTGRSYDVAFDDLTANTAFIADTSPTS